MGGEFAPPNYVIPWENESPTRHSLGENVLYSFCGVELYDKKLRAEV